MNPWWILIASIAVFVLYVSMKNKGGKKPISKEAQKLKKLIPGKSTSKGKSDWAIRLYPKIEKTPGLRRVLLSLRQRLSSVNVGVEGDLRDKSVRYTVAGAGLFVLYLLVGLKLSSSLGARLTMIATGVYIVTILFDFFISKLDKQMLGEQVDLIQLLKDNFHETKMPVKALEAAADEAPPMASAHAREIVKVLESANPDNSLLEYYDVAPNDHMRKLAGTARSVMIFGDSRVGKEESQFVEGVSKTLEEIRMDLIKREKLDNVTSGLKFMSISPIFLIEPLRNWAVKFMPETKSFFMGSLGLYATVAIYTVIIISFIGSAMVRNVSSNNRSTTNEGRFWRWMLRSLFLRRMVDRVAPSNRETRRSAKLMDVYVPKLKAASSGLKVRELFLWKWMMAFVIFFAVVGVQLTAHYQIKQTLVQVEVLSKTPTGAEIIANEKQKFETDLIRNYDKKKMTDEEFKAYLEQNPDYNRYKAFETETKDYSQEVLNRAKKFHGPAIVWYDFLVAFVLGAIGFMVPNLMLYIRASMRKWDMQTEVDGFYTNILILSKNDRIMVKELLEWMHRYSNIFEPQLRRCLVKFDSGSVDALNSLKEESGFPPMDRIVERLKRCIGGITVEEAFGDLEGERKFSLEERLLHTEKSIEARGAVGRAFGWAPLVTLAVLYLATPFGLMLFDLFQSSVGIANTLKGGG